MNFQTHLAASSPDLFAAGAADAVDRHAEVGDGDGGTGDGDGGNEEVGTGEVGTGEVGPEGGGGESAGREWESRWRSRRIPSKRPTWASSGKTFNQRATLGHCCEVTQVNDVLTLKAIQLIVVELDTCLVWELLLVPDTSEERISAL